MFTSLKSRLLLTYALIIGALLVTVGLGILLTLRNSSLLYRQQLPQLETALSKTVELIREIPGDQSLDSLLMRSASQFAVRLVLYAPDGQIAYDSEPATGAKLEFPLPPEESTPGQAQFARDARNRLWLFSSRTIFSDQTLIAASPTPRLPLQLIFRDELFKPLVRAGFIALLAAVGLAILLGNWVEAPLQKLSQQAEAVTSGDAQPIPEEGPTEVRQLVGTFNAMVEKLKDSQQSQRDFIANVSHELKTPLTSIQGFAQAIIDHDSNDPGEQKQSASIILAESQRMNKLVLDLLTLARLDAGMNEIRLVAVDVSFLLRNALERLKPQALKAKVDIIDHIEPNCMGRADAENLTQVFLNLLENAIKYTGKGGKVTITCRTTQNAIEVHFIDTGKGIPVEDQKRIFERFYQTDKSRRGGPKRGVGLGLAIAHQYIKGMDGSITLKSEVGKGSDFMVKLPGK